MTVRDETAKTPSETGTRSREEGRHTLYSMSTDQAASLPAWMRETGIQACRSGVSVVAVEAFMDNVG